jgi:hypothetical protein
VINHLLTHIHKFSSIDPEKLTLIEPYFAYKKYKKKELLLKEGQKCYDPELLYVSAAFHDLGLTPHYSSLDKSFEVDSATQLVIFSGVMEFLNKRFNWFGMLSLYIQRPQLHRIKNQKCHY